MYKVKAKLDWDQPVQEWEVPTSPSEYLRKYGDIRGENCGYPLPGEPQEDFGVMEMPEWRVYSLLRARGVEHPSALATVKRKGALPTFLALLLVERWGKDGAILILKGALEAPFGISRVLSALCLPEKLFPERKTGIGLSSRASYRLLKQALKALPYVY